MDEPSEFLFVSGTGGHTKVLRDAASLQGWKLINDLDAHDGNYRVILGFGNRKERVATSLRLLDAGCTFGSVIHPKSTIEGLTFGLSLNLGTFLAAGSVVGADCHLGSHCIVNTCASVDHDCELADHVIVCPGARLGGGVKVGKAAMIGMGAVVLPRVTIGEYATVGAGAVVTRDVPPWSVVVGCPAKVIRTVAKLEELPNP